MEIITSYLFLFTWNNWIVHKWSLLNLKNYCVFIYFVYICMFVCGCTCYDVHAKGYMSRTEDNLQESNFSVYLWFLKIKLSSLGIMGFIFISKSYCEPKCGALGGVCMYVHTCILHRWIGSDNMDTDLQAYFIYRPFSASKATKTYQ